MKPIYPLSFLACLFSVNGCAAIKHPASDADKNYISYIDNYIQQSDKPFPSELDSTITLAAIRREGTDLFITLNSTQNFEYGTMPGINYMLLADLLSEKYIFQLDFLYSVNQTGLCQSHKAKGTKGNIQINYNFLDIQYKTQVTKKIGEVCGWEDSDNKQYANNNAIRVANRNLFAAYMKIMMRSIDPYLESLQINYKLSFGMADNETLLYTYQQGPALTEQKQIELSQAVFPPIMCQFIDQFRLVDVKLKTDIIGKEGKVIKTDTQDSRSFCAQPVRNIFNLK